MYKKRIIITNVQNRYSFYDHPIVIIKYCIVIIIYFIQKIARERILFMWYLFRNKFEFLFRGAD